MPLYYCTSPDEQHRFVVRATHPWNARHKAHTYVFQWYDIDISIYDWKVEICSEDCVIDDRDFK